MESPVYEEGQAVWAKMKAAQDWSNASPGKILDTQADDKGVKYHVSFFAWNQSAWIISSNVRAYQGRLMKTMFLLQSLKNLKQIFYKSYVRES